jgi:predicted nucleotidyltransferase
MLIIREKDKKILLHIFNETLPDSLVIWAYGSRVNGTAHDGSNLDLVIRTADLQPLNIELYTTLREKIRDSNVAILVELRDWARLPIRFHEQILQKHEVLYPDANF